MATKRVAVFGVSDAVAGRLVALANQEADIELCLAISATPLPVVNIKKEHSLRPHRRTEFPQKNMIFGVPIFVGTEYISALKKNKINSCFIAELSSPKKT